MAEFRHFYAPKLLKPGELNDGTHRASAVVDSMTLAEPTHGPRERMVYAGASALSDEELLAILLGTGRKGATVNVIAAETLRTLGGRNGLRSATLGRLEKLRGVGRVKATRIVAGLELGQRVPLQKERTDAPVRSSKDAYAALRDQFRCCSVEKLVALVLDGRHRIVAIDVLGVGGLSRCGVTPREIFRALLLHDAASVILAHNHPSGDLSASPDDLAFTHRVVETGALIGIEVLDHLILTERGYRSLRDEGDLTPQ